MSFSATFLRGGSIRLQFQIFLYDLEGVRNRVIGVLLNFMHKQIGIINTNASLTLVFPQTQEAEAAW